MDRPKITRDRYKLRDLERKRQVQVDGLLACYAVGRKCTNRIRRIDKRIREIKDGL